MTDYAHPSLDDLADMREGLLPDERVRELSAHVAMCGSCTTAAAALDDVQGLLADAGSMAVPVPDSVATSLDEALRRAAAERAAGVTSLAERRTPPERVASPHDRRPRWALVAGAAAAVVVLGYAGINLLVHTSSDTDSSTSAAGSPGRSREQAPPRAAAGQTAGPANSAAKPSAAPLDKSSPQLNPKTVAGFATALTDAPRHTRRAVACGTVQVSRGASAAPVRWRGAPATVVVDPSTRRATVYDCRDDAVLFSTPY